jgi:hypothetical protein
MTMTITVKMYAPAAGQTYVCRSGNSYTASAAKYIDGVSPQDVNDLQADGCITLGDIGLPAVSGRFYGLPAGSTQAAVLTVLGTIYAIPVYIPSPVTLASLNMGITTGQTGGKARGALYYDAGGYPGAIVAGTDTGELDGTATAVVTKGSLSVSLAAGWYWFASIFTASSTMPSVTGATAIYGASLNALLGSDTAAHALAVSGQAATGISKTGQTFPATDMTTSFPTFPTGGSLVLNASTPVVVLGV